MWIRASLVVAIAAALAACSSLPTGGGSVASGTQTSAAKDSAKPKTASTTRAGLVPLRQTPIPDLPVPVGFKLVESISRSYESAGARFVDHTYEGRADKVEVEQFYREQMRSRSWTLRGSQMVRGTYLLRYEKGNEMCDVSISSEDRLTGSVARVNINLQTVGRGDPRTGPGN